jgi:hypothetical protein
MAQCPVASSSHGKLLSHPQLSSFLQQCSSSPGGRTSKARALAYPARPFNIPQGGGSAGVRIHRRHRLSTMKSGPRRDIHALLVVASQQQPGTRRALSVCLPTCLSSVCLSVLILPYISHSHIRRTTAPSYAPGHGSRLMPSCPGASSVGRGYSSTVFLWPVPATSSETPLSPTSQASSCGPSAKQQRAANLEQA